jgi:hypothetical protein
MDQPLVPRAWEASVASLAVQEVQREGSTMGQPTVPRASEAFRGEQEPLQAGPSVGRQQEPLARRLHQPLRVHRHLLPRALQPPQPLPSLRALAVFLEEQGVRHPSEAWEASAAFLEALEGHPPLAAWVAWVTCQEVLEGHPPSAAWEAWVASAACREEQEVLRREAWGALEAWGAFQAAQEAHQWEA